MMSDQENQSREKTLADVGERAWLRRVRRWFAPEGRALAIPIGDDAAALALDPAAGPLIVTTDALIEGVHFRFDWTPPRELGAKALAVNLSDLAAMAARPVAAFLALSVPSATPLHALRDFFLGLRAEGRRHGCPLAGGDMTRAPQWAIAITVMGQPVVPARPAPRSAARAGQRLYVTGRPGESGAGLAALQAGVAAPRLIRRHNRPTPRLAEAAALARLCPDLAMLDVSDGIWNDAGQLAEASGVRVELANDALCLMAGEIMAGSDAIVELSMKLKVVPLHWVLFGGEDYELLFATAADRETIMDAFGQAGIKTAVREIGRIRAGRGVHLMLSEGRELKVDDKTFKHF